jgi:hypothetical protein
MSDEPTEAVKDPARKKKRSGSEKRQRDSIIGVRVYDHERAKIEAHAAAVDLCASSYLRVVGTGAQRASERRRPSPDMKLVAKLLAECGRIGGNVHQVTKRMNLGDIPRSAEMDAAGKEARALFAAALKALGL